MCFEHASRPYTLFSPSAVLGSRSAEHPRLFRLVLSVVVLFYWLIDFPSREWLGEPFSFSLSVLILVPPVQLLQ